MLAAGSSLQEGRGSRVRFIYEGKVITFNRQHPEKKPGFIKSVTQKIPFGYGSFSLKKMTRKNYTADIEYGDEDKCFVGHVAGISAIIGFHGDNVAELRSAFEEAADDYLDNCAEEGKAAAASD